MWKRCTVFVKHIGPDLLLVGWELPTGVHDMRIVTRENVRELQNNAWNEVSRVAIERDAPLILGATKRVLVHWEALAHAVHRQHGLVKADEPFVRGRAYIVPCEPITGPVVIAGDEYGHRQWMFSSANGPFFTGVPDCCLVHASDVFEMPQDGFRNKMGTLLSRAQWEETVSVLGEDSDSESERARAT